MDQNKFFRVLPGNLPVSGHPGRGAALIQDPPDEFGIDLFHTAGRGGIPHSAPVGPPPPDDPPEAKKAVESKDDDLVCLFQPPGITGFGVVSVHDPAAVGVKKRGDQLLLLSRNALHPAGQKVHSVQMQDRSVIKTAQLFGKGGFSAAAEAQNRNFHKKPLNGRL